MKRRFTLEKKMIAQVRYYEHLYCISDGDGERIYTGRDEKLARSILRLLNGYDARKKKKLTKKKRS